jgi:hypothetical protein
MKGKTDFCVFRVVERKYSKYRISTFFRHVDIQGGSNMTGTNCDLFTHKSYRSYFNHLVQQNTPRVSSDASITSLFLEFIASQKACNKIYVNIFAVSMYSNTCTRRILKNFLTMAYMITLTSHKISIYIYIKISYPTKPRNFSSQNTW